MTTTNTIIEVGRFTYDTETSVITGPAAYMQSVEYRRCIAKIEDGTSVVFNAGMEHSPNLETALLVTIQTDFAAWHGYQQFIADHA